MSGTVLLPVQVAGRVIKGQPVQAPPLKPGNPPSTLEPGVHVHWALPDALTRGEVEEKGGVRRLLFPAVPDLWLVARFAPEISARQRAKGIPGLVRPAAATASTATAAIPNSVLPGLRAMAADRTWKGWIIESRTRRRVDLATWQPPTDYRSNEVLTAAGLLPAHVGRTGWGLHPENAFDPSTHAYYPEARNLFGVHDALDDLSVKDGSVTYVVVGWYRFANQDPVGAAFNRARLLERWKLDYEPRSYPTHDFWPIAITTGPSGADTASLPGIKPVPSGRPGPARLRAPAAADNRATVLKSKIDEMAKAAASAPVLVDVPAKFRQRGPDALVCHGTLIEVDLTPGAGQRKGTWEVKVVPTLQEAMVQAAAGKIDAQWLKAMLLDADSKTSTLAGLIGMPNEVHAREFQGRASKVKRYATLGIHPPARKVAPSSAQPATGALQAMAGNWPVIAREDKVSAKAVEIRAAQAFGSVGSVQRLAPAQPKEEEVTAFMKQVATAIAAINADHKGDVEPRLLRVDDDRHVQPTGARRMAPAGPTGRTFWVDTTDRAAMKDLLFIATGARVSLPTRDTVWEEPSARWYRPWSPHVFMLNAGRGYRYGYDGRYDSHGRLRCRMNGYTYSSINMPFGGDQPRTAVSGSQLLGQTAMLARPGVPAVVRSVLEEALLLDPSNADDIARAWIVNYKRENPQQPVPAVAEVQKKFRARMIANLILRSPDLKPEQTADLEPPDYTGERPSEVSFVPWEQAWEPLFANVTYTFEPSLPGALGPVDMSVGPAQGTPIQGTERQLITATISNLLDSAIVSKVVFDPNGKHMHASSPPPGLGPDAFLRYDALGTALTGFDELLHERGLNLRAGHLRIDSVQVVGQLGTTQSMTAPAGGKEWRTELAPRLTTWGRIQTRLWSATSDREADDAHPPIVGFAIPDLLEHTLEIYDHEGTALGQLVSEPPVLHSAATLTATQPTQALTPTPAVRFEPHPWHPASGANMNALLRSFIDGVINAARTEVHPKVGTLHESSLTAMMRVMDTLRGTVDATDKQGDAKVRKLGSPIAIIRARMWLERTEQKVPHGEPPLMSDPTAIQVKVGTTAQPDDSVLGCFMPGSTPAGSDAHFRPVDAAALKGTVVNGLADATAGIKNIDACHSFVHDPSGADTTFSLTGTEPRDLLLFMDINGGVYVTTGVLPRKCISIPREFIEPALRQFEPSFLVGPVLSAPSGDIANAVLPVPSVQGYRTEWVQLGQTTGAPIPPLPPSGLLPEKRVAITEGWINLVHPH